MLILRLRIFILTADSIRCSSVTAEHVAATHVLPKVRADAEKAGVFPTMK